LRSLGQSAQLAHAKIAARELIHQSPPQRMARQPQEARRQGLRLCAHAGHRPGNYINVV
jgi:hypothetical protein